MYDPACIFCRIASGEIPAERVLETEHALVFRDIHPAAPVHCLVIPKQHIPTANELDAVPAEALADLLRAAAAAAKALGVAEDGWRLVANVNRDGGQEVFHLHLHLLGGRRLRWPVG
ncbi:MAG: HIT domain-containing protein [Deltaproteobacteria bacterium]|nr:HIT domain-containing protein [Deltaproteobacteria bacterium]